MAAKARQPKLRRSDLSKLQRLVIDAILLGNSYSRGNWVQKLTIYTRTQEQGYRGTWNSLQESVDILAGRRILTNSKKKFAGLYYKVNRRRYLVVK